MFLLERAVLSAIEIGSSVDLLGRYANRSGSKVSVLASRLILTAVPGQVIKNNYNIDNH